MTSRSIEETLRVAAESIDECSDQPLLEAQILLAFLMDKNRSYLYSWPELELSDSQLKRYHDLLQRRFVGEPVAYLTGSKEFWSLLLKVTPDVLIPRPETELLVELALKLLPEDACKMADLGTGSGAIALALATERPLWDITAIDKSEAALAVAQENARTLELTDRVQFQSGSWCDPLTSLQDAIISNPPYIAEHDPHLQQSALQHEPMMALSSGKDGLDDIHVIAETARTHLKARGWLLMEHGFDQQPQVIEILENLGYENIDGHIDDQGQPRAISARIG